MITSMTGFGTGEATADGISIGVEVRSLNSRYLDIFSNLPKKLYFKDFEMRDLVKSKISRGKINIAISIEYTGSTANTAVKANLALAEAYFNEMQEVRKHLKIKDLVTLDDVLKFPDIFKNTEGDETTEREWTLVVQALADALGKLNVMRRNEGRELERDLHNRMTNIERNVDKVEAMAKDRIPQERQKLREKIDRKSVV